MAKRAKARLPRGFRDIFSEDYKLRREMLDKIQAVYESYGFEPLETPAVEFVETLGKFLPESDQPDAGIFAFQVDEMWHALRYDLTASLSRIMAMNKDIPKPYRRYQVGPVWRLEKPGPGRYREFTQFDIDTVGSGLMACDAEICMVLSDSLEALGFNRGEYVIKVNNRKILDGLIDIAMANGDDQSRQNQIAEWFKARHNNVKDNKIEITPELEHEHKLDIMRSIDKLDRIGIEGVIQILQKGRRDDTGDFKSGCFLTENQIAPIVDFLKLDCSSRAKYLDGVGKIELSEIGQEGLKELREIDEFLTGAGYDDTRIAFDAQIVRGLSYYTGPVYEVVLTIETTDDKGKPTQFGSVGGGGRYDTLVMRFTGQKMAATGASIGVDRLLHAYKSKVTDSPKTATQVLVTVMDRPRLADYQQMAAELRAASIVTELYLGKKPIGKQTKYANDRGIPIAVIVGEDEFNAGEVTLKDLKLGAELASGITDRDEWSKGQPAQMQVKRTELVEAVKGILARA
ncbi:MAG: histidine--tRNA ligase [candidate division Zixibacteria bacterium]|nr:histidine--tRNA ligase [candidate division Zixibacteria bacterium]